MNTMNKIWESIKSLFTTIGKLIRKVIQGIIRFSEHIINWFKKLKLDKGKHIPFVSDIQMPQFKELLKNAPVKNIGLFEGVYDEEQDKITHHRLIEADELDEETKNMLGKEELVVLS